MKLKASTLLETAIALGIVSVCICVGGVVFLRTMNSGTTVERLKMETIFQNWVMEQYKFEREMEVLILPNENYEIEIDNNDKFQRVTLLSRGELIRECYFPANYFNDK